MGILGNLGKIIGIGAAPFTGGASLALTGADIAGSILGGMGKGAADERTAQNLAMQGRDRNAISLYGTQQAAQNQLLQMAERAALDRANLGITAPSARQKQLVAGSLLANLKPLSISPTSSKVKIPTISGGLTPAALSGLARSGGNEMQRQALLALLTKSDIPAQQDYSKALLQAPQLSAIQQPGKLESVGSILGPILSGVGRLRQPATPVMTPPYNPQAGGPMPNPLGPSQFQPRAQFRTG